MSAAPRAAVLALAAIGTALASCGAKAPFPVLERFPVSARYVCEEQDVDAEGKTTTRKTEDTCALVGDLIRCTTRDLAGVEPDLVTEQRVDAAGIWTLGSHEVTGARYRFEPPILYLPADAAPGRAWVTDFAATFEVPGEPPDRQSYQRKASIAASERCPGGLLITTDRSGGGRELHIETLVCEGEGFAREVSLRSTREGRSRTARTTCSE